MSLLLFQTPGDDVTLAAPVADASASALVPVVDTGNRTVVAPIADGTASALVPSVLIVAATEVTQVVLEVAGSTNPERQISQVVLEVAGFGTPVVEPPTESDETIVCVPTPMPLAVIPAVEATIHTAALSRVLNGADAEGFMKAARWSSEVNGGHGAAQIDILLTEYKANLDVYRYGAEMTLRVAPGYPDAGAVLYTGYLDGPAKSSEQIATLSAVGYQQLLREAQDPLLWQTWHSQDWNETDSQPWGGSFNNDDSINLGVRHAALVWQVPKNQDIDNGDTARIGFWMDDDVNVTRVAGTIRKNKPVPGSPAYSFKLQRFDGPMSPGSQQNVQDFSSQISSGANANDFHVILGVPKPAVTFTMERIGGSGTTENSWRLWITDVRVNGDAYQDGRNPDDTYSTHYAAKDIAELAGIGNTVELVGSSSDNCLPLWSQSGKAWSETLDHLALIVTGAHGWKWAVWDRDDSGDIRFEFRDFGRNNVKWQTYAYTADAVSIADIDRLADDLYTKVMVTFHTTASNRMHRRHADVVPNPFADLDPPLAGRKRVKHIHVPEPLPPGATLPQAIADKLALYYSTPQYGGTIQSVSLSDGIRSRWAGQARAGELISICDYPNDDGSTGRVFRILSVDAADDGATTITVGRNPNTLPRIMHRLHERAREHALHHQHH